MPHGLQPPVRGPYGSRREMQYDATWSHPPPHGPPGPPPTRTTPPAVSPYAPPTRMQRPAVHSSEYHLHPPSHHHPPAYYGGPRSWRESSPVHHEQPYYTQHHHHHHGPPPPPPPPPAHYRHHPHEMTGEEYGRPPPPPPPPSSHLHHGPPPPMRSHPYLPMQVDRDPPPPQFRREGAPLTPKPPTIQFRPSSSGTTEDSNSVSPPKKSPARKDKSGKKKKGDALSLLAKVSSAMADPDEEDKEEMKDAPDAKAKVDAEDEPGKKSPVRQPAPSSPVAMWTPKGREDVPRPTLSRQITPVDQHRYGGPSWSRSAGHRPPPLPREHYSAGAPPPPRYRHDPYYSPWAQAPHLPPQMPESSPVVISERNSFEEAYHDREPVYASPPREDLAYAPYTYVQQPRMEEKTILRKKFSWKHYPEVRVKQ